MIDQQGVRPAEALLQAFHPYPRSCRHGSGPQESLHHPYRNAPQRPAHTGHKGNILFVINTQDL
eukprot:49221-Eustigmatos_ZCMA.PRE.1